MEQQSRLNGASATSGKQAADSTSRIKPAHALGLLALNGEKTDVPSNAMSPLSAWAAKINAMDTGVPSRASSSASDFSTPSVADSVEFTETNPEAMRGLGLGIDENDKAAHESEKQDISGVSTPSAPMQQLCLEKLEQEPGQEAPAIDQKAPGDTGVDDTESDSEGGDIAVGATPSAPIQTLASGGASISTSRVQVLNMRA
jgi:hypothetical protein